MHSIDPVTDDAASHSVAIGPLLDEDLSVLFEWINRPDQVHWNSAYRPVTETDHREWFDAIRRRGDVAIFAIRVMPEKRLIGSCQLRGIDPVHHHAELQIRIGEVGERGKGHGTEAVRLLLRFGFRDLNLHRIYLNVFAHNAAAIRAYEKAGLRREGVLRQAAHIDGKYVDVVVMAILRDEFQEG
jgi:RimJ/RimL family protein N-acetyltransferase